jgi:hypothetical protein
LQRLRTYQNDLINPMGPASELAGLFVPGRGFCSLGFILLPGNPQVQIYQDGWRRLKMFLSFFSSFLGGSGQRFRASFRACCRLWF